VDAATSGKAALLLAAGLLLVGAGARCARSAGPTPAPTAIGSPSPTLRPYIATLLAQDAEAQKTREARLEITPFCTVELPESWRTALEDGKVPLPDDVYFILHDLAPDGAQVFGDLYSDGWSGVVAVNREGTITRIRAFANPEQDQTDEAFDGRWLVWEEGHSISNWNDWDIRAWDSQTNEVFDIGTAPRVNGEPVSGPFVIPVVSNGRAAWLQANQSGHLEVHLYDLERRQDSVVSESDALQPVLFWGSRLLWGERFTENGQQAGHLVMMDAATGKRLEVPEPLASLRSVATLGVSGDLVAWSEDHHDVKVWRDGDQKARLILSDLDQSVDWIRVAGKLVTWHGYHGPRVADLRSGSIALLNDEGNGYAFTNGDTLALSKPVGRVVVPKEDVVALNHADIEVVDVTRLPPLPGCSS
jgi:hypothetical protein